MSEDSILDADIEPTDEELTAIETGAEGCPDDWDGGDE